MFQIFVIASSSLAVYRCDLFMKVLIEIKMFAICCIHTVIICMTVSTRLCKASVCMEFAQINISSPIHSLPGVTSFHLSNLKNFIHVSQTFGTCRCFAFCFLGKRLNKYGESVYNLAL